MRCTVIGFGRFVKDGRLREAGRSIGHGEVNRRVVVGGRCVDCLVLVLLWLRVLVKTGHKELLQKVFVRVDAARVELFGSLDSSG